MLRQLSRISVVVAAMILSVSIAAGPIHDAAQEGSLERVKVLLDNGADVNARDLGNATPLHLAADLGYESVAKILLRNEADVSIKNKNNKTPAALARYLGHQGVLRAMRNYFISGENAPKGSRRMRLNMLQKKRKEQFTATDAGAHIKYERRKRQKK